MRPSNPDSHSLSTRASQVVLAAVLVTAVSGYFMGLHQLNRAHPVSASFARPDGGTMSPAGAAEGVPAEQEHPGVRAVVGYGEWGDAGLKPNATWHSTLASLTPVSAVGAPGSPGIHPSPRSGHTPTPTASTAVVATDAERQRAVQRRASRRAFDGAPPVVPHPVDATSSANCRVCHAVGLAVRDVVAPRMSHPEMGNCTQCHVPSDGSVPGVAPEWVAALGGNAFVGQASVGRGSRAWPGAPPTIPHGVWMRENCSSCHGPTGLAGLRTSHPERALCTQCHVPDGGFAVGLAELAELSGPGPAAGLNSAR